MSVRLKAWNWQVVAIGAPGSGKSFWMRRASWAEAQRTGGVLLVHDPTNSWDEDPQVPKRRYASGVELQRGLAETGSRVAHVLDVDDADQVLAVGIKVAHANLAAAKNGRYTPVLVVTDEAVEAEGAEARKLSPLWRKAIARRRHFGIGIGITAQSAFFAHRSVMTLATRIEVFRVMDPADENRLRAVGLRDPGLVARLVELPDREHITVQNGRVTAVNDRPYSG